MCAAALGQVTVPGDYERLLSGKMGSRSLALHLHLHINVSKEGTQNGHERRPGRVQQEGRAPVGPPAPARGFDVTLLFDELCPDRRRAGEPLPANGEPMNDPAALIPVHQ